MFFAFFILTDPPTSPVKYADQLVCGVIVAVASYAIFELVGAAYYLLRACWLATSGKPGAGGACTRAGALMAASQVLCLVDALGLMVAPGHAPPGLGASSCKKLRIGGVGRILFVGWAAKIEILISE